jgi:hypothetical protein
MELKFEFFLQWSQESSLPVSRTMVTLCGGEPTVSETVKVTLWRKESLFEGFGSDPPCGSVWVLRGNISAFCVAEREYWGGFIMKKRASSRRRKG